MANVDIYYHENNKRSKVIAEAVLCGVRRIGDNPSMINSRSYNGQVGDYAVFYGLAGNNKRIFDDYETSIHVDLGYLNRRLRSRYDGYHKMIVNSRHPTDYFQRFQHSSDRFNDLGIMLKDFQGKGNKIIVAAMSAKASRAEEIPHGKWEREIIEEIRGYTDIPIHYRPKPNCMRTSKIAGTVSDGTLSIYSSLVGCHAVVARQSNCCIDALISGIPSYSERGIASIESMDIEDIASARLPEGRDQLLYDLAYTQFNLHEIALGKPFVHMKKEGLI